MHDYNLYYPEHRDGDEGKPYDALFLSLLCAPAGHKKKAICCGAYIHGNESPFLIISGGFVTLFSFTLKSERMTTANPKNAETSKTS